MPSYTPYSTAAKKTFAASNEINIPFYIFKNTYEDFKIWKQKTTFVMKSKMTQFLRTLD